MTNRDDLQPLLSRRLLLAPGRYDWSFHGLCGCGHCGDAGACCWSLGGGCGSWLRGALSQSQRLAYLGVEFGHDVLVVFQELAGILAALADALAFVAVPRAGLFDDVVVRSQIKQIAFARDALAVENVELGVAEGRGNLVFDHFYASARTGD